MNRIVKNITLITLLLIGETSFANIFATKELLCDTCERHLNFRFESTSFQKNNEYESEFAQGITGIGVMLRPTIEYYVHKNTKVNLGAFGVKYSGVNGFSNLIPIFQVHHKIIDGFEVVFGNIYGNLNHDLAEPIYRFDRYYRNNVEYGFQALHKSRFVESDLWVNWEKFIFDGDPFQEEFTAGNHTKVKLFQSNHFDIQGNIQALLSHKGGEIDTYEGPAIYIFNGAYGADFTIKTKHLKFNIKPKVFWYRGLRIPPDGNNFQHYKHGSGFLLSTDADHKYANLECGYWKGKKFIASRGEYLFMSVSEANSKLHQDNREIVYSKLRVKRHITKNLKLELRANLYVDLQNTFLPDYSYGIYFVANELFFLKKLKKYRYP